MKRIIGLIIGLVAALGFVGQANAYPPIKTATITTSNSSPAAGAPVTLTVNGFCPNATVTFSAGGVTLGEFLGAPLRLGTKGGGRSRSGAMRGVTPRNLRQLRRRGVPVIR